MSNDMADGGNIGVIVSVVTLVGSVVTFIKFWTGLTEKITDAKNKAESALQEAAEAKNDLENFREALNAMTRDMHDRLERVGREVGESNAAIRAHVTESNFFVRDNFVRNDVFLAAMSKIDAGQLRTEAKLDRLFEQGRGG